MIPYRKPATTLAVVLVSLLGGAETGRCQGLLWDLPPDGSWVRYEGTYSHVDRREDSVIGAIRPWTRHLWIKSVGRDMAEFRGETVPCRWVEIKMVTGRVSETGLDPGPLGSRIYKVLVPESAVVGRLTDEGIPVSMIPIVEGYRRFGDGPVEEIGAEVLQVYPVLTLLQHYRQWESEPESAEALEIALDTVQARKFAAQKTIESRVSRSTSTAELWLSEEIPFGLARWSITVIRERKDAIQPRSAFEPVAEITEVMEAHETGTDAQSELQIPEN